MTQRRFTVDDARPAARAFIDRCLEIQRQHGASGVCDPLDYERAVYEVAVVTARWMNLAPQVPAVEPDPPAKPADLLDALRASVQAAATAQCGHRWGACPGRLAIIVDGEPTMHPHVCDQRSDHESHICGCSATKENDGPAR